MSTTVEISPIEAENKDSNILNNVSKKYEKLFQDGKLVQIHVSKWSMSRPLTETDLAIGEKLAKVVSLGRVMLIDPKHLAKFVSIEQKARRCLDCNSFNYDIASAHFVPKKNIVNVIKKLHSYADKFNEEVASFVQNYETYKNDMLEKYPQYAEASKPCYLPVDSLTKHFSFRLSIFEVTFPKKLKTLDFEDIVAREEAKAQLKEELRELYEKEMESQYQHALTGMEEFVKTSVNALRGQVVEVFDTLANKIRNKEVISKVNIKSVKRIIEDFNSLDFFDDNIVKEKLKVVTELVNSTDDFKNNDSAVEKLNIALGDVLTVARDISDVDSITGNYFRRLDT